MKKYPTNIEISKYLNSLLGNLVEIRSISSFEGGYFHIIGVLEKIEEEGFEEFHERTVYKVETKTQKSLRFTPTIGIVYFNLSLIKNINKNIIELTSSTEYVKNDFPPVHEILSLLKTRTFRVDMNEHIFRRQGLLMPQIYGKLFYDKKLEDFSIANSSTAIVCRFPSSTIQKYFKGVINIMF